ncbi:MAG: ammonium transporter [Oscillatoriales cyanobacterium]|nr:MAG: ammonium transporter [Oscillatoriales cyanobacterium]
MTAIDLVWMLICSGLVFLMQAGFMCLESGMTRSKNSINVAIKNLADFGLSVALFWAFGFALMFGVSRWGWWGQGAIFPNLDAPDRAVFFLYQAMFCGTSTTIVSGVVAERMRFSAYLAIAALVSGLIYPVFGHWAWNGSIHRTLDPMNQTQGWLEQLGFVDFAGSTVVHSIGAWVGLAAVITIGARRGRFPDATGGAGSGRVAKIQGSNMPFSVLGAMLLWFGWIGFNGGSNFALDATVPGILLNTMLGGVAGLLVGAGLSAAIDHRVEAEPLINSTLAGLVAITASAHAVDAPLAVIIGGTGAAIALLVARLLIYWRIDDAVDAVAVHGGAGTWGTLCVGLFGDLARLDTGLGRLAQIGVQGLGIVVALVWALGVSWLVLRSLDRFLPLRISIEDEELGLNLSEHNAKTETYDLFQVMDRQAETHDLSLRVPVEPFTEIGHIAARYNQVMDAFEARHHKSVEDLAEIYYVTAAIAAAIEHDTFDADQLGLENVIDRADEIGALARAISQMADALQKRDLELTRLTQQLTQSHLDPEASA